MNPLALLFFLAPKKSSSASTPKLAAPKKKAAVLVPKSKPVATKNDRPKAVTTPAPWPAKAPPNLPPFPSGWEPDSPPSQPIIARAAQLIPSLWARGAGSYVTEFFGGRWLTFVAKTHGKKRAVEAWRPKSRAAVRPVVTPKAPKPVVVTPAKTTPTSTAPVSSPVMPSVALPPTVRRGDGMGMREAMSPTVVQAQKLLNAHGASLQPDGDFGSKTETAAREYQRAYGLEPDGVIGPLTWTKLLGG